MKRTAAGLLACILMILSVGGLTAVCADAGVSIAAAGVVGKPGETVLVPIRLEKNSGLAVIDIRFQYDADALTLIEGRNGDVFSTFGGKTKNYTIYNGDGSNVTKTGTLMTLVFKVKPDAEPGDYAVKPVVNSAAKTEGSGSDLNELDVLCATANGSITVAGSRTHIHRWSSAVPITLPKCDSQGVSMYLCLTCGDLYTEPNAARGHTAPDSQGKCRRCGALLP